ncbi:MAG: histidine kinase [Sediminicola sp.]|tara:strand:+ start:24544 stop:25593 length:1050 start_codon:yes stop_codon:yes gene_type:complete
MGTDLRENPGEFHLIEALVRKKFSIYRHATGVVLLFALFISIKPLREHNIPDLLTTLLVILGVFYVNLYVLLPKFLYTKKYSIYLGSMFLLLVLSLLALNIVHSFFDDPNQLGPDNETPSLLIQFIVYCALLGPFILVSTGVKIFQKWVKYDNRIKELEKNTVEMELKALRNQINPHFIFNTLNNLNYLVAKDQKKASVVLARLSDFLSHHLYENNQKYVSLESEINFINDYLNLESIRRDNFSFNVLPPQEDALEVPTNIFSVFVENAIKHSLDPTEASSISVSFEESDHLLIFKCVNTKSIRSKSGTNKGVGLKNVKRRLELLFPDTHTLSIMDMDKTYKVEITFPI